MMVGAVDSGAVRIMRGGGSIGLNKAYVNGRPTFKAKSEVLTCRGFLWHLNQLLNHYPAPRS